MSTKRHPVAIVGGTGLVGRRLARALLDHPVFCCGPIIGSSLSAGRPFREVWEAKEKKLVDHYGDQLCECALVAAQRSASYCSSVAALSSLRC